MKVHVNILHSLQLKESMPQVHACGPALLGSEEYDQMRQQSH